MRVICAVFDVVALMTIVDVSAFRATIATIIDEEDQGGSQSQQQQQRCRQQVQHRLQQCQQYLQKGQWSPHDELPMNPLHQQEQQQQLRQCCNQLRSFDEQCRCETIRHFVRGVQQEQGQQGGQGGQQGQQGQQQQQEQLIQKARRLPQQCNLEPSDVVRPKVDQKCIMTRCKTGGA